jgi:hypothetical protein
VRIGDLHIISDTELKRLYKVFRPANLEEKAVLEGQIADLHLQLENLQRDYDAAIEAGDRAADRAERAIKIRKAVLAERNAQIEQIRLLEQQIKDLTDAVQNPPEKDEPKDPKDQTQTILDEAQKRIGFTDDLTSSVVMSYIQREIRLRGDDAAESILAEVLAGGIIEEDEETRERE